VTAIADYSGRSRLIRRLRNPAAWSDMTDVLAILIALSLPWSTSLVGIFSVALLLSIAPFLDLRAFGQSLRRPICAAPISLFAVALVGTLWSDAAWGARLYAVGPTLKLLFLPVLLFHFERSERGPWVFAAFLASCTVLAVLSWLVALYPDLSLKAANSAGAARGIFVKNYIDQSQEFALCAVALAYPILNLLRSRRYLAAALLLAILAAFIFNMAFVIVSRTALVTMPIMLLVFGLLHLSWRTNLMILFAAVALSLLAWSVSPRLQWTIQTFSRDYQLYKERGTSTSIGERLEYWHKSLRFFIEAPILGHGTGSTRGLFEQVAVGPTHLAAAQVISNPHNQTLNVAVQWGALGIVLLYTMWILHLLLFRGDDLANWIGLLVVVQNVFTSLFNSHIFDFHEGWMYVLGVGVAGGMVLRRGPKTQISQPTSS
jgi:O-antigen ligase